MSHNIHHFDYPADVSKDEVFQQLNNFVRCEDWGEGGHLHPIRWLSEPPLDSRYDAEQYIEKNDKGWYDCLAVRYREPKPGVQSKAYLDLQQRFRKADMRYREMNQEVYETHDRDRTLCPCQRVVSPGCDCVCRAYCWYYIRNRTIRAGRRIESDVDDTVEYLHDLHFWQVHRQNCDGLPGFV